MQARRAGGDFVFPSAVKPSRPVSEYPLHKLLPPGVTLHGMRSAFRDFCAEQTHYRERFAKRPWRTASAMLSSEVIGAPICWSKDAN